MTLWLRLGLLCLAFWCSVRSGASAGDLPRGVQNALKLRAGHDLGCNRISFRDVGGNGYQASGCGKSATYVCTTTGYDTTCALNSAISESQVEERAPTGNVSRRFDEERQLHVVSAKFNGFPRHITVDVMGAPQAILDRVHIRAFMHSVPSNTTQCDRFAIRINDQPFTGTEVRPNSDRGQWKSEVKGQFAFADFRPLGRRHSTFGLEFCGEKLSFTENQVAELRKFLEIFSQIAQDVQDGALQQQTPPAGGVVAL